LVVVDRAGRFVYVSEFDGRRISRIDSRTGRVAALVRP
jgi:DNA-binding beta-propeller fold protein YncE